MRNGSMVKAVRRGMARGSRRRAAAGLLAGAMTGAWAALLGGALPVGAGLAHAGAPMQEGQAPGWYRFKLGGFEVTALNDGSIELDPKILANVTPRDAKALLDQAFQPVPTPTPVNVFLVNTGERLVLVDAGASNLFGPTLGRLVANLKASGYQPEQVDDVLVTHLHPDHVGGITLDGQALFPNATVHVDARDSAYWLSKENLARAPKDTQPFFQGAQSAAAPYVAAGRWKTHLQSDAPVVPGIRSWSYGRNPGHTPGHQGYLVESDGQKLLVWGDVVHFAAVQFARPAVTIAFDSEPAQAAATRQTLFRELADQRVLVGAAHVAFPGLGYLRQDRGAYAWVPVAWQPGR